jgi:hypothetical protein
MCIMHAILSTFLAAIFSFFQSQPVHHSQTFIPPEQAAYAAMLEPGSQTEFAPTRQELVHHQLGRSYAEGAWAASPHRMNVNF